MDFEMKNKKGPDESFLDGLFSSKDDEDAFIVKFCEVLKNAPFVPDVVKLRLEIMDRCRSFSDKIFDLGARYADPTSKWPEELLVSVLDYLNLVDAGFETFIATLADEPPTSSEGEA